MKLPMAVRLVDKATGEPVNARIRPMQKADVETWKKWLYGKNNPEKVWDWAANLKLAQEYPTRYECYAVASESHLEGLIMLDLDGREVEGARYVGVEYICRNPKNHKKGSGVGLIGLALMSIAVKRSFERGIQDRLWLEAKPDAVRFYTLLRMKTHSVSPEGFPIYMLEGPELANEVLEDAGAEVDFNAED